jgi:hypothetical protein
MADIMYDVNLAEAEINDNHQIFGHNNEKKQELLNSIFKKHKITRQEFDTSLVWYNAHMETYFKICDRVNKRYVAGMDLLQKKIDEEARLLAKLNRVNIFEGEPGFFLQAASQLQNSISLKVDSFEWNRGDNLEITFDILGLDKGMKPELLCYVLCEDTIIFEKEKIQSNGSFLKSMPSGMDKVKCFSASIHIPDSIPHANIFINNFGIFHCKTFQKNREKVI